MSTDDELGRLLRDAVDDLEPTDRLGELRARTTTTRGTGLRWGAALAVAATVAIVAGVVATTDAPEPSHPPVATDPTSAGPTSDGGRAVAAYFIGETPRGPRLYREFQRVESPAPGLAGLQLLENGPVDPDYSSDWPAGSFLLDRISDPEAGLVHVFLDGAAPELSELTDLAQQQVAYTVGAGFGEPLSVVFHRGQEVSAPVSPLAQLEILAPVNLSDPSEGQPVEDVLGVAGRASSFEANVPWRVEGTDLAGSFTATGWMGARLFPFSGEVDVSSLDPGTYTLIVETDDPSGGAEGPGATSDTRTFVVQ